MDDARDSAAMGGVSASASDASLGTEAPLPWVKGQSGNPSGISRAQAVAQRDLGDELRRRLPSSVIATFELAILARKCRVRVVLDDDRNVAGVEWDEDGIPPSDELVHKVLERVQNRIHGLPAQSLQLKASLGVDAAGAGALSDGVSGALRALIDQARSAMGEREIAGASGASDAPALPEAIDAECVETGDESACSESASDDD